MRPRVMGYATIGLPLILLAVTLTASMAATQRSAASSEALVRPFEDYRGSHRFSLDQDPEDYPVAAPGDTIILASYSFETGIVNCMDDGWASVDHTAQVGDFFHVAQGGGGIHNELSGGDYGRLTPLRGNKSLWCGAYADYPTSPAGVICGYASMPGYGNDWNQAFRTKDCLSVFAGASVTFLATWDSEPGYDGTTIEIDECNDAWIPAGPVNAGGGQFEGIVVDSLHTHVIPDSLHSGSLRIRFHFESDGIWSDEDALWDTDGAILIDSLSVSDASGLLLAVEDFEDEAEGATSADDWTSDTPPGYGDYAGLISGYNVVQLDPCRSELTCMWNFFTGSEANYACGNFPGQPAVPYGNDDGQYIRQSIRSPLIPWVGGGSSPVAELAFAVYRNLPSDALVRYTWHVASVVNGCLQPFRSRGRVYRGERDEWFTAIEPFGDLVEPGATDIQVQLGVIDMCPYWCGVVGSGYCHTQAPLFDEVVVRRFQGAAPIWNVLDEDLFQDTFAEDGTINPTSTGRADAALDINPRTTPAIRPGDSVTVRVSAPENGLAVDPYTGSGTAVYAYVAVWPRNQPGKSGDALTSDNSRWPVVDSLEHTRGPWVWWSWNTTNTWYCIRMDTAFSDGAARTGAAQDAFCIDLNDNLFTVGDTIGFVFCAESQTGDRTYWTPFLGTTQSQQRAMDAPDEFQILPGGGYNRGGDILYVDGMNGRGAEPLFGTAFTMMGIRHEVDRYDIRSPSSWAGNRPGGRVVDVHNQIIAPYRSIIWNTGDLASGTIGDGTGSPEKSDDAFLLFTFLDQSTKRGGVYFNGDNLASELLSSYGSAAINLRSAYMLYNIVSTNHRYLGHGNNPRVVGAEDGAFDHTLGADEMIAYGGCPVMNEFDVIQATGSAITEMTYSGVSGHGAVISQRTTNSAGEEVGVLLAGFSLHYIRDVSPSGVMARTHFLRDTLHYLGHNLPIPLSHETPSSISSLSQNYPNPFNPVTSIQFTVRERTPVRLHVYNVAGQLVRTLVDDVRAPGIVHTIEWGGLNNAGQSVSSGVYFYRLVTKEFTQTRKMVLLK